MKDNEKDKGTGTEPAAEEKTGPATLDRGTFLKALGIGIGAVGLDVVTGGHVAARTAADLEGDRRAIQKLVRGLLEEPTRAKDFLDNPQAVAKEFGVILNDADAMKIQEALKQLGNQVAAAAAGGHEDWAHQDGSWNDWYTKKVEKKIKSPGGTTAPGTMAPGTAKPPSGKKQR